MTKLNDLDYACDLCGHYIDDCVCPKPTEAEPCQVIYIEDYIRNKYEKGEL